MTLLGFGALIFLCHFPPLYTMSLSLKSLVQNSKFLTGLLTPVSKVYAGAAGYRQIGN
jgi:hypothetical protein